MSTLNQEGKLFDSHRIASVKYSDQFLSIKMMNFTDIETNCTKKSRKRTRNPDKHKHIRQKQKVQSGEEHTTVSGKIIEKKIFQAQISCGRCAKNCCQNIDSLRQEEIFNSFYRLVNWTQKTLFLRTFVKSSSVCVKLNPIIRQKEKNFTNKYYLSDRFGKQHQVCLTFLLNCLQIARSRMHSAARTITSNETAKQNRGRFPTRKTNESDITFVKEFIDKFPKYESHYKISRSNRKYLSPFLNIKTLYREYCSKCNLERMKPLSEWKFRQIFGTEFNLSFARLKVDTCRKCDMLNILIQSQKHTSIQRNNFEQQRKEHLELVQELKDEFRETVELARNPENKTEVYTFDLQRALEMPVIQTSEVYYMRQLWLYNLGVYDEVRKVGYMYVWTEAVASRGSQEIASCLHKHLMKYIPNDTQKIILRSDACSGQNRNIKMSLMLKKFLSMWKHPELTSIEQHFFVSGHSYNICDRSFGLIEIQKQKTKDIYIPEHWINDVIRQAKKTDPKFVVVEMSKNDFFSSKPLEVLITNRKKSTSGEKINWLKMQKIIYERYSPFLLDFVDYGSSSTVTVSLQKKGTQEDFKAINLPLLYPESRKIAHLKYQDLQKLLKYIPDQYHEYFQSLKHDNDSLSKDFAFAARQSSDEEESDKEM